MHDAPIVIVTGAAGGIGRVIATTLASSGWFVVLNDLDHQSASDVSATISRDGGQSLAIGGDIADENSVEQLFKALEPYRRPQASLLINNAAVQTWASLQTLSVQDWKRTIDTNLTGCFLMTKHFAQFAADGSSIVNIGSGCNKLAFPNLVDYSASKGGIEMLTKSSALELGQRGIRVNCIAPGAISTDRTAAETDDYDQSWATLTPLQRIGKPEDVANAVMLLADPRASFITGQTINVDGGLFSRAIWPVDY
jgi:NAD(P)-dependent dehydrogenase (short-subunit alcohol dehydrogenase family)